MNGSSVGSYPTPPSSSFPSPDFKNFSFSAADELQNEVLRYRRAQSSTPYSTSKQRIKTAEELHDYLQRFHAGSGGSILNQSLPATIADGGGGGPDQSFATAQVGPGSGPGPVGPGSGPAQVGPGSTQMGPGSGSLVDWPPPRILPNVDLSYLANEKYQPSPLKTVEI
jgi:hypothetical protein